jgi:hypothetical protein
MLAGILPLRKRKAMEDEAQVEASGTTMPSADAVVLPLLRLGPLDGLALALAELDDVVVDSPSPPA